MSNDETAVPRLVAIDRRQLFLRTVDVEKLIEQEHCVRSIWELVGRLDLRLYYAQIAAVEGSAGREHTDPQLLISLWLYAYSRGISSARELARQCEYEPGCQWLGGVQAVSPSHFVGVPLRQQIRTRRSIHAGAGHAERRRPDHSRTGYAGRHQD